MTKDELLAENERLGAEIAAHRVLLAAVRELATVPKPANWREVDYLCNLETRLITLRAYAGHVDDVHPDIMVRVLHDRATTLREEADTPVRYEVRADDEYRITPKGIAVADAGGEDCGQVHHQDASVHCGRPASHLAAGSWHVAPDGTSWEQQPAPVTDGEPWTRAGVAAAIVPAPSVPNPPYHMTPGTIGPCCLAEDGGYICNAQDGHDGPQHVAYGSEGQECHRWPVDAEPAPPGMQDPKPVARVITDSGRTCDQSHPGSGAPCHRSGDHGVHRDPDGEEWRTDGEPTAIEPRSGCKCGHIGTVHFLDLLAGGDLTFCHVCDCGQYEYVQPASVTA